MASEPTGRSSRVAQFVIGIVCGGIGGAAGGLIVAGILSAGVRWAAIFQMGASFCFSVVGILLGVLWAAFCRTPRSRRGFLVGTAIGFGIGLGVAFIGNRLMHGDPASVGQWFQNFTNSEWLGVFAVGSLVCVGLGAIVGMVVTRRRAGGNDVAEPDAK